MSFPVISRTSMRFCHIKGSHKLVNYARPADGVALLTLNRPRTFNQLGKNLMAELRTVLEHCDQDKTIGAIVLSGQERSFSIGADIKELLELDHPSLDEFKIFDDWDVVSKVKKPLIAAVNGYVLGGGCELAMMCDIIYAGDNAQFGQPEIFLGTIPGCGGTQRLIRAVGKSLAMEIVLSGSKISALEAKKAGLISKVFPTKEVVAEAVKLGGQIASVSPIAVSMIKESLNAGFEMNLQNGLHFERRLFHSTFATEDRKEGMLAFMEKRIPSWTGR